jgi:hypothetical protein
MSRGLGTFQRRILDALEPAQPVCRRPGEQTMRPKEPHDGPCIPEYCYGWLPKGVPWEWAQLPLDVYDLVDVRAYLSWQEAPRWAEVVRAAGDPGRHPFTPERVAWALAQVGKPHARSFGADIARALRGLLERAELVPCHRIELVRYIPHRVSMPAAILGHGSTTTATRKPCCTTPRSAACGSSDGVRRSGRMTSTYRLLVTQHHAPWFRLGRPTKGADDGRPAHE